MVSPRLKPTALKSRPPQSGDDRRAAAHDVPEQSGPVVLDHQHDRSLIDTEVIRRDPPTSRAIRHGKRLIEGRLESVLRGHPQLHSSKVPHGRNDDFRSKRERGDDDPGSDSAVIWTEWGAPSDVIEELALDAVEYTLPPAGSVGCREAPTVFAVANEIPGIADRVFLLNKRRLPAVFKVVAASRPHEFVADAAKVDPHMRELMGEERPRVKQFTIVDVLPLVSRTIGAITLGRQRMRWRTESEDIEQQAFVIPFPAVLDEPVFRRPPLLKGGPALRDP